MVSVTADNIRKLRRYLNDDTPTSSVTDQDLNDLMADADNLYAAAAEGWRIKAAHAASPGEVTKYSIGQESYERSSGGDYASYCLQMAKMYDDMSAKASKTGGSLLLTVGRPDVL